MQILRPQKSETASEFYDPHKSTKQISKQILSQCRKHTIVITLKYLGKPDQAQFNLKTITHNLVCRIQNLFPDNCIICKEQYCITLSDPPFLSCEVCEQEVHKQCFQTLLGQNSSSININPQNIPGIHYICHVCEKEVIPQKLNKDTHSPREPPSHIDPTIIVKATDLPDSQNEEILEEEEEEEDYTDTQPHHGSYLSRLKERNLRDEIPLTQGGFFNSVDTPQIQIQRESSRRFEATTREKKDHNTSINDHTEPENTKKTCRFYIKGKCKFNENHKHKSTTYIHPPVCQKFVKYGNYSPNGCTDQKKCNHFHPIMCKTSLKKNCKYKHIKGTKRNRKSA